MILRTGKLHRSKNDGAGFTLIEFILVMTLLMVVFGVAAPSLSNFFKGRTLDGEARRLLALTGYAQSRAVSEGLPMILWIDSNAGTYGVEREYGYEEIDSKSAAYECNPGLEIEPVLSPQQTRTANRMGQSRGRGRSLPVLRFQPDGFLEGGTAVAVEIREADAQEYVLWIAPNRTGLRYEIQTNLTLNHMVDSTR